ncbi:MAG: alkene reductase [Panacagrimonas sp.]
MTSPLLTPIKLGALQLKHRVILAPLTRMRAAADGSPTPLNATYYEQRASDGGLLITEATQISPQGTGYPSTPGIFTEAHIEGWKPVTAAVHAKGGKIFNQMFHVGRISHSLYHDGALPVAPSAIAAEGVAFTPKWEMVPFETPRALETKELAGVVEQFRHAAECAKKAGFDGVEVHGANGYLLDQFLQDNANQRTDEYGGSFANRARLLLEVVDAVIKVWGSDHVGVRLSPYGLLNGTQDKDPIGLFTHVVTELAKRKLAYLHMVEPRATLAGYTDDDAPAHASSTKLFRDMFKGPVIVAGGFDQASGEAAIDSGLGDAVAYGRIFISNPDLPQRFAKKASLNKYDRATFYGGAEAGYTDYPAMS